MDTGATRTQWWLAAPGNLLVWARLQTFADGHVEVLGADGELRHFPDDDPAVYALLDAEFRALDGLDADDAAALGLDLATLHPPAAENMQALLPLMAVQRENRHGS